MMNSNILLAVNGTLMRGLKLNPNMLAVGAEFVSNAYTAPCYRCWTINDDHPGMLRTPGEGARIALELWAVPPPDWAKSCKTNRPGCASAKWSWTTDAKCWGC